MVILPGSSSCIFSFYIIFLFTLQFVSPLRFSHIYSEKLVHLPHCYFVNDYKQVRFDSLSPHVFNIMFLSGFRNLLLCIAIVTRKILMSWIQTACLRDLITDYLKTNFSLHVSISCTRWILIFSPRGKYMSVS